MGCQRVKYLLVLVEMIKYLLVFVEMIKLQSYACLLFIIANKDTTEHFLELYMVGGSTEPADYSGLNSEQNHQFYLGYSGFTLL